MRAFLSKPNKLYNHDSLTSDYIEELSLKASSQPAMTNGGMTAALCTERSTREEVTSAKTCDKNRASEQVVHNDVVWWPVHKNCTKFAAQTQECDHAQHCTMQYTVFCTAGRCSAVLHGTHPSTQQWALFICTLLAVWGCWCARTMKMNILPSSRNPVPDASLLWLVSDRGTRPAQQKPLKLSNQFWLYVPPDKIAHSLQRRSSQPILWLM